MRRKPPLRPHYLDASVLVKLVLDEPYSNRIRGYFASADHSTRICTSYCFGEALSVLKRKYKEKNSKVNAKVYSSCVRRLNNNIRDGFLSVENADFEDYSVFSEAERIFNAYSIDFVDAFQIVTVSRSWPEIGGRSVPLLVTADGPLSKAAASEGIEVWYCRETHEPPK